MYLTTSFLATYGPLIVLSFGLLVHLMIRWQLLSGFAAHCLSVCLLALGISLYIPDPLGWEYYDTGWMLTLSMVWMMCRRRTK